MASSSPKAAGAVPVVFVSSTSDDLTAFRRAAEQGVQIARCFPETHELWPAKDNPPLRECLARVRNADVLVVIVAYRYGWVPHDQPGGERHSITRLECEEAAACGKEVLAFLVDESVAWPEETREEYELVKAVRTGNAPEIAAEVQDNVKRLSAFKTWLRGRGIRDTFTSPEDLRGKVALALQDWKQRHPEFDPGDVRMPGAASPFRDVTPYLDALRDETAYIEIRGLRTSEGMAHRFALNDLYIPLTNELAERGAGLPESARATEGTSVEQNSALDTALKHPRLVIAGDPGAGKSTYLKRIVCGICETRLGATGGMAPAAAHFDADRFPIFIRVSDLAAYIGRPASVGGHVEALDSPMWIVRFLEQQCATLWGLDGDFFLKQLKEGPCLLALDGLDETPDARAREHVARIVTSAARVWPRCRIVVSTRPKAYSDAAVLAGFAEARIGSLDRAMVRTFLRRWSEALFAQNPGNAGQHADELVNAVESCADIRRMARNPVMLTALAVLHWNEKRLPQQRAELYESILTWLSQSRKLKANRPGPERCIALLQELALAMQNDPAGRLVQAPREWAAAVLAPRFREIASKDEQLERASEFLDEEELDSGIVVRRGADVRFWHLTFQEHLAARALAGAEDAERRTLLFTRGCAWQPEWREVGLLLAGLLHQQKVERVDALFSAALDTLGGTSFPRRLLVWLTGKPALPDQARCVSLLGAMLLDLEPLKYKPKDERFDQILRAVMGIFEVGWCETVALKTRIEAAEALGRAGDPRLREQNWVTIPAGTFTMGEGEEAHEVS